LLDQTTAQGVCNASLNKTQPPGLPTPTTTNPNAAPQVTTGNTAQPGSNVTISSGGLAVFSCSPSSGDEFVVGFDMYSRSISWTVDVSSYTNFGVGTDHLFLVTKSQSQGNALNSGTTSYTLTAKSLETGSNSWTVALPVSNVENDYTDNSLDVTEGPSGNSSNPEIVELTMLGSSAFDSGTGQLLWHTNNQYNTQASGSYVGYNVVESSNYQDGFGNGRTGFNPATDAQLWANPVPGNCNDSGFYTQSWGDQVVGNDEWLFSSDCYFAYNYQNGQTVASGSIPSEWTNANNSSFIASPTGALVDDGTNLSYYAWSNLTSPVWSAPADSASPIAIGSSRVLVQGTTQLLFLSIANGSIVGSLAGVSLQEPQVVTNGLVVNGNSVVDVG
jgi:hypothetical protein